MIKNETLVQYYIGHARMTNTHTKDIYTNTHTHPFTYPGDDTIQKEIIVNKGCVQKITPQW